MSTPALWLIQILHLVTFDCVSPLALTQYPRRSFSVKSIINRQLIFSKNGGKDRVFQRSLSAKVYGVQHIANNRGGKPDTVTDLRSSTVIDPEELNRSKKWRRREILRIFRFSLPALSITMADPLMSFIDAVCIGRGGSTLQVSLERGRGGREGGRLETEMKRGS